MQKDKVKTLLQLKVHTYIRCLQIAIVTDLKEDYEVIPVLRSLLTADNSTQPRKGLPQHGDLGPLLFLNSGVGSFMSHKNQISVNVVRTDLRFSVLVGED